MGVPFIKRDKWQPGSILLDSSLWNWLPSLVRSMGNSRAYFSEGKEEEVTILLGQDVKLSSKQVSQKPLSF